MATEGGAKVQEHDVGVRIRGVVRAEAGQSVQRIALRVDQPRIAGVDPGGDVLPLASVDPELDGAAVAVLAHQGLEVEDVGEGDPQVPALRHGHRGGDQPRVRYVVGRHGHPGSVTPVDGVDGPGPRGARLVGGPDGSWGEEGVDRRARVCDVGVGEHEAGGHQIPCAERVVRQRERDGGGEQVGHLAVERDGDGHLTGRKRTERRHGDRVALRKGEARIVGDNGEDGAVQGPDPEVVDGHGEPSRLAAVEDAIVVAGVRRVVERGGPDARQGHDDEALHQPSAGGVRCDRARAHAPVGERLGDPGGLVGGGDRCGGDEGVPRVEEGGVVGHQAEGADQDVDPSAVDRVEALGRVGLEGDVRAELSARPHLAGVVHLGVPVRVQGAAVRRVRERLVREDVPVAQSVDRRVCRVRLATDAEVGRIVRDGGCRPRAHSVGAREIIAFAQHDVETGRVAPALVDAAADRAGARNEATEHVVGPLVGDERRVQRAVRIGRAHQRDVGRSQLQRGGEGIPVVLEHRHCGDGDLRDPGRAGERAGIGHPRGVDLDHPHRAGVLHVLRLHVVIAAAVVHERDGAGEVGVEGVAREVVAVPLGPCQRGRDGRVRGAEHCGRGDVGVVGRDHLAHRGPGEEVDHRGEAVGRRDGVGLVSHAGVVLGLDAELDGVALRPSPAVVGHLGVPGLLVEAGVVVGVCQPVDDVERVRPGGIRLLRAGSGVCGEVVVPGVDFGRGCVDLRVAGPEACGGSAIHVGPRGVAAQGRRAVRDPRVRAAVGVLVQAIDREHAWSVHVEGVAVGGAGRVRAEIGVGAVLWGEIGLGPRLVGGVRAQAAALKDDAGARVDQRALGLRRRRVVDEHLKLPGLRERAVGGGDQYAPRARGYLPQLRSPHGVELQPAQPSGMLAQRGGCERPAGHPPEHGDGRVGCREQRRGATSGAHPRDVGPEGDRHGGERRPEQHLHVGADHLDTVGFGVERDPRPARRDHAHGGDPEQSGDVASEPPGRGLLDEGGACDGGGVGVAGHGAWGEELDASVGRHRSWRRLRGRRGDQECQGDDDVGGAAQDRRGV